MPTPQELKRALQTAGFEVYRTRGQEIVIAERPRENQIMDAGIVITASEPLKVAFITRAQKSDFPNDADGVLVDRARALAVTALTRGYTERETAARAMRDPGDATRVLDTWHEVVFEKSVASLEEAFEEIRFALALDKTAH